MNRNRILSTPYLKKVRIYINRPPAPFVNWELVSGVINFSAHADSFNVIEYILEYQGETFSSRMGSFEMPANRFEKFIGTFYSVRQDGTRSDPTIVNIDLNEDKPPVGRVLLENPYSGGPIRFIIQDDWDSPSDMSIKANFEDIATLYSDGYLLPMIELSEGTYTLNIKVTDSSDNDWVYSRKQTVVKIPPAEIPELYIEEGTLRQAKWKINAEKPIIQRFTEGKWQDIIFPGNTESSAPLSSEFVSPDGDLYRLLLKSEDKFYLPSLPIFAKESYFRRFTSQYIVSLMGGDALFSGGNSYTLHGNIVVKGGSVLRVEPGTEINFTRGNILLVGGVMDLDGRKENIKFGSIGSAGTIEVSTGGSLIARGVDFGNTMLIVNEGAVIVLDHCRMNADFVVNGARSIQIYDSEFQSNILFDKVGEFTISGSSFKDREFKINFVSQLEIVRSNIETEELILGDSNLRILDSKLKLQQLHINELSSLKVFGGFFDIEKGFIDKGSSVQIDNKTSIETFAKINVTRFSSFRISSELKDKFEIIEDSHSFSDIY